MHTIKIIYIYILYFISIIFLKIDLSIINKELNKITKKTPLKYLKETFNNQSIILISRLIQRPRLQETASLETKLVLPVADLLAQFKNAFDI